MKSCGYKLINYIFFIAVYDLLPPLDQFVAAVPPKIPRSGIEEFVEPVFKVLFIVEGNALIWFNKEWLHGSENTADAKGPPI